MSMGAPARVRHPWLLAAAGAACAAAIALVAVQRHRGAVAGSATLVDLIPEIVAGRTAAVERAREVAARNWPASAPASLAMLAHDDWRIRLAACHILADHLHEKSPEVLVPRASDTDWRVRAAAFGLLARQVPAGEPPALRDTPMEAREKWLLDWLAAHDQDSPAKLAPELCELYADARHVEFGPRLAARCLACHAGASPAPPQAADVCRQCHPETHEAWTGSAHAQSLTHLRLATVNPRTREPEPWNFGEIRGIGCGECHRTAGPPRREVTAGSPRGSECPFAFDASTPAPDTCQRCPAGVVRAARSAEARDG
jgi:hypothetical protein